MLLTPRALPEEDPLPPDDRVLPPDLGLVYERQRGRLRRFLARVTRADDADDLVQQAFARVLAQQADGVAMSCPDAYLFRTGRNLAIDAARSARRQARSSHIALDEIDLPGLDQVAALEARDLLHRLERILLKLKPRTREIFLAHRIDGYSYNEIAARTGLSVKGVEKHMSRAIAHIDRSMRSR